jgi:putative methyltransferase (TIGR04325 family)
VSEPLKKAVRLLTPPILLAAVRRLRGRNEMALLEYAPQGWQTSLDRNSSNQGWNVETIVAVEKEKWNGFCHNLEGPKPLGFSHEDNDLSIVRSSYFHNIHITYAYVLALAARYKSRLSLLDWGGGLGHYYLLGRAVLPEVEIEFHCREVPLMCEQGNELCPEVNFHADDTCLERNYDVVMINGSLGYFPDWQNLLARLCGTAKDYLFLTRVLVVEQSPTFVARQHTDVYNYNSEMLTQVFNRNEVLQTVAATGFQLVREFVVGPGPTVAGAPEQCLDCGWLFKRDDADRAKSN